MPRGTGFQPVTSRLIVLRFVLGLIKRSVMATKALRPFCAAA